MSRRHLAHQWARYSVTAPLSTGIELDDSESSVARLKGGEADTGSLLAIAEEYFGLDRILQRWNVSVSGGMQTEVWDDSKIARPPPLDEDHAYIIDRIVCGLKKREKRLITYWYRKNIGIRQIKRKLHIRTSADLRAELSDCLKNVCSRVRACNSTSLIELMEISK